MAFQGIQQTNKVPQNSTEKVGAFSGYIRRPKMHHTGITAQIFGENGEDADIILALSLSHFQDSRVFINIYLIKNADGVSLKDNGKYPNIASFEGFIRRSNPTREGMVAQLFAANGDNADQVAELSKSNYQDCLVFVDIRGPFAATTKPLLESENNIEIDQNYSKKITKKQKEDYQKKEKAYKKMNDQLYFSGLLVKAEVLGLLGEPIQFKQWLEKNQHCGIHMEDVAHCLNSAEAILVPGLPVPFNYYPVCSKHKEQILDDNLFDKNKFYYQIKHHNLQQSWAQQRLKELFSIDGDSEPNPTLVLEWLHSKNVKGIPEKYKPVP